MFSQCQRDQSKKRGDSHHFESNGSGGKATCNFIIDLEISFIYILYVYSIFFMINDLRIQLSVLKVCMGNIMERSQR